MAARQVDTRLSHHLSYSRSIQRPAQVAVPTQALNLSCLQVYRVRLGYLNNSLHWVSQPGNSWDLLGTSSH